MYKRKGLTVLFMFVIVFCSYPSLSWQLLVLLYHAAEKVIFMVDQPQPLTISALDISTSSKVSNRVCMQFALHKVPEMKTLIEKILYWFLVTKLSNLFVTQRASEASECLCGWVGGWALTQQLLDNA